MNEPATREDLIKEATALVRKLGYARVGMVANDLHIGYVTSVRVIEDMQERGILAEYDAGRAYWPAIPAPQPCGHDARYIWPPDASDPDDEHQPTKYCLKCAFDALGDAMTASLRDANDLRNALNISGALAFDLKQESKDLRGELEHLRTEREREPGNDMLKVMHACSVSAYTEAKAERAAYGDKMTSRVGELEAENVKLRSVFVEAQKKVHAGYHGVGTPIEECGDMNCIAAIKAGA